MRARVPSCLAVVLVLASGCAQSEQAEPSAEPTSEPTVEPASKIDVELREFEISADPDTGAAGSVTFTIANEGEEVHEFAVIRTDLDPGRLPIKGDGSVDEDKVDGIGEVEDLGPGKSEKLKVDLDPGPYALVCNLVEEEHGEVQMHYKLGMRTGFTVR